MRSYKQGKFLYPRNFLTTHKIACRTYNRMKQEFDEKLFIKQRNDNIILEWKYGDYSIIYPKTTQDIKDEAVQQNHCVASYISRVIEGLTNILFMRKTEELETSLITLEVSNFTIRQSKGRFNRDCNNEEYKIVKDYQKYLKKIKEKCELQKDVA